MMTLKASSAVMRPLAADSTRPARPSCRQAATPAPRRSRSLGTRCLATAAAAAAPASSSVKAPPALPYRVGHGFDLHRLVDQTQANGYKLWIGGLEIPHTKGCEAHSDGDVLLHTVVDAVLGALGKPDIGQMFPDTDPRWKGCDSKVFMREAIRVMEEEGYVIGNLDCTIIAERPKLSPHKVAIRDSVAALCHAHPSVVNIKAKTHEKVDAIGEQRAIGCHAVVMLIRKELMAQQ